MKNRLVFILSFLGLLVASYLSYEYLTAASITCPIGGKSCDIVRLSPYASFFGISTPLYGVAYYFAMMVGVFFVMAGWMRRLMKNLTFIATVLSVLFGIYLTYLEAFVIRAYCIWCISSFIITIVLLAILTFREDDN